MSDLPERAPWHPRSGQLPPREPQKLFSAEDFMSKDGEHANAKAAAVIANAKIRPLIEALRQVKLTSQELDCDVPGVIP